MKKRSKVLLDVICVMAVCAFLFIIIFLIVEPALPSVGVQKSTKADTSGSGITKDTIVFECSYGDVTFTHKKHNVDYKIDCYDSKCHHTWNKEKEQKSGDLCRDCHKKQAEGNTPSKKDAFHKSCKGCHEDMKKDGKPTGPTTCRKCHKKK